MVTFRAFQTFRSLLDAVDGRYISTASTFSTILLNVVLERSDAPSASRVLDIGCGRSPYRGLLGEDLYVGIDRSDGSNERRLFLAGDATSLPVRDRQFDGVLCTEVIEHVEDERLLLREVTRIASDHATLVLTSPFVHGLHEQPFDFRRLTSIGLVSLIESHGWHVISVHSVGGPMVVAVDSAIRWFDPLSQRAGRLLAKLGVGGSNAPRRLSSFVQKAAAASALVSPISRLGEVDPMAADPRLTLGYVVVARLRSRHDPLHDE